MIVSADCLWVCFKWETWIFSKGFSCVSNNMPNLHHCNWEETRAFVLKFWALVHWTLCLQSGSYSKGRDQNRADMTHTATKQLEKVNSKSSGCSNLLKWFRRNFNLWMQTLLASCTDNAVLCVQDCWSEFLLESDAYFKWSCWRENARLHFWIYGWQCLLRCSC